VNNVQDSSFKTYLEDKSGITKLGVWVTNPNEGLSSLVSIEDYYLKTQLNENFKRAEFGTPMKHIFTANPLTRMTPLGQLHLIFTKKKYLVKLA
jgi:hypothetical protein